jgi:hypothetical protein
MTLLAPAAGIRFSYVNAHAAHPSGIACFHENQDTLSFFFFLPEGTDGTFATFSFSFSGRGSGSGSGSVNVAPLNEAGFN